jgi:hypothetical protein
MLEYRKKLTLRQGRSYLATGQQLGRTLQLGEILHAHKCASDSIRVAPFDIFPAMCLFSPRSGPVC